MSKIISKAHADQLKCFIQIWTDAHNNWKFIKRRTVERDRSKKQLAFLIPSISKGAINLWDQPLLSIFLPTFIQSLKDSSPDKHIMVYLGVDEGDPIYDNPKSIQIIHDKLKGHHIDVTFVRLPQYKIITLIWNTLYSIAIADGFDYYFQANDDLQFPQANPDWLQSLFDQMDRQDGEGLVGPNDPVFNCRIMTQTLVTRKHWEQFGWYFPPDLHNWHCDTWISLVYPKHLTGCLNNVTIVNARYGKNGRKARYTPCIKAAYSLFL